MYVVAGKFSRISLGGRKGGSKRGRWRGGERGWEKTGAWSRGRTGCTCRCIGGGGQTGIRAVAPAHLPHPLVAGRRITVPPLAARLPRPSVFSPAFFSPIGRLFCQPAMRRSRTGLAWAFCFRVVFYIYRPVTTARFPIRNRARVVCTRARSLSIYRARYPRTKKFLCVCGARNYMSSARQNTFEAFRVCNCFQQFYTIPNDTAI